jgi:hypothetical protein
MRFPSLFLVRAHPLSDLSIRSPQFNMSFYMTYLARWPDYFHAAVSPGGRVIGYSMSLVTLHLCLGVPACHKFAVVVCC